MPVRIPVTGGIVRVCALSLALAAGTPALASRLVDPASARRETTAPSVVARDAELAALEAAGRSAELAARLDVIARDATLSDVAQEWLLDRGLHALARLDATPASRATVARLAARAPAVYTRVEPEHGGRATPLYDTGATARFVLRSWERREARAATTAALSARDTRIARRFADEPSQDARAGAADAFREAPLADIAVQRATITAALGQGLGVDALALVLAERLADTALFGLLIDYADGREALAAVASAPRALDPVAAMAILARASRRADIASAAVLAAGGLAAQDAGARQFLFDALSDPGIAPSAAAALGALGDPDVRAELGRRLAAARNDAERAVLLLALNLDGNPAARAELERFARAGAGSPRLRAKARRWADP